MNTIKNFITGLLIIIGILYNLQLVDGATLGIHGIQDIGPKQLHKREQEHKSTIPLIGMIFDTYGSGEQKKLTDIVTQLGTGRIYHISISPFGYTAAEVAEGRFDATYKRFFTDIKSLGIKVVFRTMHEMNGGRYSRASHPHEFKRAWVRVWKLSRKIGLSSDQILFSLSFNSQDLPTKDERPTQSSSIQFCSERRVRNKERCPRKADYYPGKKYVDLIGVTLYNRGRSRPDRRSKWKSPSELLSEDGLMTGLQQWNKPIIIDELGTTAVDFSGERSQDRVYEVFRNNSFLKNSRIAQRRDVLIQYPLIKAIVYFNLDDTAGASSQVLGQADRSMVMSPHHSDYKQAVQRLTIYNNSGSLLNIFQKR